MMLHNFANALLNRYKDYITGPEPVINRVRINTDGIIIKITPPTQKFWSNARRMYYQIALLHQEKKI